MMRSCAGAALIAGLALGTVGCAKGVVRAELVSALRGPTVVPSIVPSIADGLQDPPAQDPEEGPSGARVDPLGDDDPTAAPRWSRRPADQEVAVIRKQLTSANQQRWDDYRSRRTRVTGFMSLNHVADQDATRGIARNLEWKTLVEEGVSAGLELGHELVPAFGVFVGAKYDRYQGDSTVVSRIPTVVETRASDLRSFPFYAGAQLNFPLALSSADWFSGDHAGLSYGVIPFVRVAGGAVFVDGNEFSVIDRTSGGAPFEYDLFKRGFSAYGNVEVGVEYRTKSGFGIALSIGAERYFGLELDSAAKRNLGGASASDLRQAILPRLSASVYF